ncbi:ABC transporter permease [Streptomyces sp. M19]
MAVVLAANIAVNAALAALNPLAASEQSAAREQGGGRTGPRPERAPRERAAPRPAAALGPYRAGRPRPGGAGGRRGRGARPHDPLGQHPADMLRGPGGGHVLGTDYLGRDVLSRLLAGTRLSLAGALEAVAAALVLGVVPGVASVWLGRTVDWTVQRAADTLMIMPFTVFAIAVVGALGNGMHQAMLALGVLYAPLYFRVTRAAALGLKQAQYVEAAELMGASRWWILRTHVWSKILPTVAVTTAQAIGQALLVVSSLTFLGLGVQPPAPTWAACSPPTSATSPAAVGPAAPRRRHHDHGRGAEPPRGRRPRQRPGRGPPRPAPAAARPDRGPGSRRGRHPGTAPPGARPDPAPPPRPAPNPYRPRRPSTVSQPADPRAMWPTRGTRTMPPTRRTRTTPPTRAPRPS